MGKNDKKKDSRFNDTIFTRRGIHDFPNGAPEKFVHVSGASVKYIEFPSAIYFVAGTIIGLIIGVGMSLLISQAL